MKEKLLNSLSLTTVSLGLLVAKLTLGGPDFSLAIAVVALSGVYALDKYLQKAQDNRFAKLEQQIVDIKDKEINDIKASLTALKMANSNIKRLNEQPQAQKDTTKRFF